MCCGGRSRLQIYESPIVDAGCTGNLNWGFIIYHPSCIDRSIHVYLVSSDDGESLETFARSWFQAITMASWTNSQQ